ncbi:histone acetyltransferase subunit NuA4-domain protein [Arabidopsis thaliana]|uniref:Histone acetyltransferase subunit NuA4-domain protein n=1 Tax=Arabidopsis thaliana TaxID=3702 RepID=F4JVF3_ARATH|nr:histone acetyltransferase subunit NuA4-domain protein [Arabidopsis thaliana]NP_001328481.1 histone acetyltransferase subunit NuA4-domain protein [Arabidopsis thaliana]NP_001328482.1 histone acetyltransferase subunit NuA4-domain protein [Arabidopsis thaliana]NP_001328483.1 histone acetyltransferase subunit NuA4-domain protein [Arabidopsis thaliana]NP_974547.1 histone acetyltransferase subunit NuA4-domain protein [Arabidopsis thaliana]AEE83434.1 histone acetyltransferase subunit NuA4-domain p|eukprot:NP_001328479.1 histone acetyltransferase subunit NuA4-domain protein [Arabidopsis thaliana]
MSLGQKSSTDPGAMLTSLLNKREKLRQELRSIEKQVYELETSYLQESSHIGNALKGFEGFLSSSKSTASAKRSRKFQPEDRVFSLSSVTSPAVCFRQFLSPSFICKDVFCFVVLVCNRINCRKNIWFPF